MKCDLCRESKCYGGKNCFSGRLDTSLEYDSEELLMHRTATGIESEYYMKKTRIEELILYCRQMQWQRIGVAFCVGLKEETKTFCSYLRRHFEVFSVCCKVCGIAKEELALPKIKEERYEAMCHPLMQAEVLKRKKTDLNVTVGLCVGHDILFNKHSHTVVSALVVKDRVLGHNPAAALYSGYYKRLLGPE